MVEMQDEKKLEEKNNEKMNINIILYITAIGIIFSTIFFIYNLVF